MISKNVKKRQETSEHLLEFKHISKAPKKMTTRVETNEAVSSNLSAPAQEKTNVSDLSIKPEIQNSIVNSVTSIDPDNEALSVSHKVAASQVGNKLTSEEELPSSKKDSMDSICSTDSLKRYTQLPNSLPQLRPSEDHAVLFNYNTTPGCVPLPHPKMYKDKWDNFHVRLPCSPQSLYPVKNALTGEDELQSRWTMIQSALSKPIQSIIDLEEAILTYNSKYSKKWNLKLLNQLFTEELKPTETNDFFENVLPKMIDLCLQIPNICTQPIPLLKTGRNFQITLSQKQIASLLANAFFCTFPKRNSKYKNSEYSSYPAINFNTLYSADGRLIRLEKLKCLINYFRRVTKDEPTGVVTFHRQCIEHFPEWRQSEKVLKNLCTQSEGLIEVDGTGMLQVDFADEFVGGLVLKSGCVQEEIRFLICPELILSRLFTERLHRNEALIVTGCEQFNQYTGYALSFCWDGNFEDCIPSDSWGRKVTKVVAIDATRFTRNLEQYEPELVCRELNKAFAGFSEPIFAQHTLPAVATGNWGCGVFRGDPRLKALIQLISATEAGRDILYFTFNDKQLEKDLQRIVNFLKSKNVKVGQLVKMIEDFYEQVVKVKVKDSLYSYLFQKCIDSYS